MSEDWSAIADEVLGAIAEVGFAVTLRKRTQVAATPWAAGADTFTDSTMTVIDDRYRIKDAAGNLLHQSMRTITAGVSGVVPAKADRVIIRGATCEVIEVRPLAPGGVDLLYEIDLAEAN